MKDGTCTKCDGEKVYEIREASMPNYEYTNSVVPLTLTAHYGPTGKSGFFGDKMARATVKVSAFVCGTCGYTELYAKDLELLAQMAVKGQGGVLPVLRKKR